MGYSGNLEKLTIIAYENSDFNVEAGRLQVYINPAQYSRQYRICYNDTEAQGSLTGAPDFQKAPSENLELDLVFDGTGVVPSPLPGVVPNTEDGIVDQINKFLDLTFEYHGDIHSPYYLKLVWGQLLFKGRLESFNITYTLFKPDGTPLRGQGKAVFKEYMNEVQQAKEAKKSSPDVSHLITVEAGDTLPLMCYSIYGSSAYYPQVARVNGLTDFRSVAAGSQLLFPPLGEIVE